jgi:hypothetical protein
MPNDKLTVEEIGEGLGSFLRTYVTPDLDEYNRGYEDGPRLSREELLAVASLPDYLLGKIARLLSGGGSLFSKLDKESDAIIDVRIGAILSGLVVQGAAEGSDALETAEQLFAAFTEYAEANPMEAAALLTGGAAAYGSGTTALVTKEPKSSFAGGVVVGTLAAPATVSAVGYYWLDKTDALDTDQLEALKFADEQCVALCIGLVSLSHVRVLKDYDKAKGVAARVATSIETSVEQYLHGE